MSGNRNRAVRLLFLAVLFFTLLDGFVSLPPTNQTGTQSSAQSPIFPTPKSREPYTPFFDEVLQSVQNLMQPAYMRLRGWGIPAVSATTSNFGITGTGSTSYPTSTAQSFTTTGGGYTWLYSGNSSYSGECFGNTSEYAMTSVTFDIEKSGSPTGTGNIQLFATTGTPNSSCGVSGGTLATSQNLDVSTLTTSFATYTFSFSTPYELAANTNYAVAFYYAGGSGSNKIVTGAVNTPAYTNGNFVSHNASSWIYDASYDGYFQINGYQLKGYTKGTRVQYTGATTAASAVTGFSFNVSTYTSGDKVVLGFYGGSASAPGTEYWNSATAGTSCGATGLCVISYNAAGASVDNGWDRSLTSSAYYWFVWQFSGVDAGPSYVSGGAAGTGIYKAQTFGTLDSTWTGGTLSTENWSMYLTYTVPTYTLSVGSAYDTPTGAGTYDSGTSVSSSVTSPVSGGAGIQYVCTGWTGTGSAPASGSVTSTGSFTITQASSVTWNWQTQYYLSTFSTGVPQPADYTWIDDSLPGNPTIGAAFTWVASPKFSGTQAWQVTGTGVGLQSYFYSSSVTVNPAVYPYAYVRVYLDPTNPPDELMLQFYSDTFEHRVFWGSDLMSWGTYGTVSRTSYGRLPPTGQWVMLQIKLSDLGLTTPISGMAFSLGKSAGTETATFDLVTFSTSQVLSVQGWQNSGVMASSSVATPVGCGAGCQYVTTGWTGTGSMPSGGTVGSSTTGSYAITQASSATWSWKQQYQLTVASAQGSPSPYGVGTTWVDAGSVTESVTSPVSGGDGVQYVVTGWTGTGSVPSSGSAGSTTFTLGAVSSVTWNWKTQYQLTITLNGHGVGNVTSGWRDSGTVVGIGISGDSSNSSSTRYLYNGATGTGTGSYTGAGQAFQVTVNAAITESIAWTTQHALAVTLNGYGTATLFPTGGWYASGTGVSVTIGSDGSNTTSVRHVITNIAGSGTNSYSSSTPGTSQFSVTMDATAITESLTWTSQYTLIITLNGHGVSNVTSGSWYSSGVVVGVQISGDSTNSSSTQYLYSGATGTGTVSYTGSAREFQVTVNGAITESIAWQERYYLLMAAGSGGTVLPSSGWQNSGANVTITATPNTHYTFTSWTGAGAGSYSGTANPHWIMMGNAMNETASFTLMTVSITITSSPTGSGYVLVDGNVVTTPQAYSWVIGASHNVTAVSVASCGTGCQYLFQTWSDGGARSHSYTVPSSPATVTASFQQQYQVTFASSGIGSDASSATMLTVNGTAYQASTLAFTSWYNSGVHLTYAFNSTISPSTGKQYAWNVTSGLGQTLRSNTLTVSASGTVSGGFKAQFQLTHSVTPPSSGTVDISPPSSGGWYDNGTVVSATPNAASNYAFTGWTLDGSSAGSTTPLQITTSAAHALVADFVAQLTMTVSYQVNGGGSPTAPTFHYVQATASKNYTLTASPAPIQVDTGSAWSVSPNPLSGSGASERWMSSDTLSGTASSTTLVFRFYHQYLETLSYLITNGGSPAAPSFAASRFGSSTPQTLTGTATGYWFDAGASWAVTNPLTGSTGTERWTAAEAASGTVSSAITSAFHYLHQYYLTMLLNPSNANATLIPTSGWQNATATVQMLVIPSLAYSFSGWAGSGSGSYSGTENPSAINMTATITETAFLELRHVVNISMISNPPGSGYIQVDGNSVSTPIVFSWDVGSAHNITALSSAGVLSWVNWSDAGGRSHVITVPNVTATYTANYGSQITVTSSPAAGSGYVLADGSSTTTPHTFTWIVGSSHTLTANATVSCGAGCQYAFQSWSDSGPREHSITAPTTTTTYTASFVTQAIMTVSYQVLGGGSPTPPTLSYIQNGAAKNYTLTVTPAPLTLDGATQWSVSPNPLTESGASERWRSTQSINGTSSATTIVFTFYHQHIQTLSYSINGGGSGYTVPSFNSTKYGVPVSQVLSTSATGYWFDSGVSWVVANPLAGSTSTERWNTSQTTTGTVSSAQTVALTYQHQYYLSLSKSPPSHGKAGVLLGNGTIVQNPTWENSGASLAMIAIGVPGHTFSTWNSPDGSGYTGQTNPFQLVISHPVQEMALFNSPTPLSVTVTSNPTGSGYVMLNGTAVTAPYTFTGGVGEVYNLTAISPVSGYQFVSWSDLGDQSHVVALPNATSITYTATYGVPEQITVTSNPTGAGYASVDGSTMTTPHTYTWLSNSQHNVTATGTVSGGTGTRYVYASWSDSGARSHLITVPATETTYTANYQTQYYLTMSAGTGGTASPSSAWEDASARVQIQATPNSGYAFNSWMGTGAGSYSGTANPYNITMSGPMDESATFSQTIQVTVTSNPTGSGYVDVDGTNMTTPQTLTWVVGSNHTVAAFSTPSCGAGCQYAFTGWSDSGARSHTVTAPSEATTITATFQQQYYLAISAGTGGTVSPNSGWTDSGTATQIEATPSGSNIFQSWTGAGSGSYSGSNNPTTITVNGPVTEHASFAAGTVLITITSSPTGLGFVAVDSNTITAPQTFNWTIGSQHTIAALSPVAGSTGTQYVFTSWSDAGAQSHTITVPSSTTTFTATFTTQHYLTVQSATGGTASPSSGWHDAGAQVQMEATPSDGYTFASWAGSGTGSYTGTSNPAEVTVNGPITETPSFAQIVASANVQSATGQGTLLVNTNTGSVENLTAIAEGTLPTQGKPALQFPYGFVRFKITGILPDSTVTVTLTFPASIPTNSQYWKYQDDLGWVNLSSHMGSNNGDNTITLTLTDGAPGDQDGTVNGVINDDGGIGEPPTPAVAGNAGNGTVIVTGVPPTITSIQIDPGDGSNASAINVDTYYLIKVNVTDPNQLTSLQRLELRLYQNSTTWPGNLDLERRQGFAWEYNGTWYQVGGSGWTGPDGVYFNATGSSHPNLSGAQGTFTFRVKVPKVSHYTQNGGWYVEAYVTDKSNNAAWKTNLFDIHLYAALTIPDTITWSASAGDVGKEASGMPFAIQYQTNAVVKLQIASTNPTSQYADHFDANNLKISGTTDPNGTHSQSLSGASTDWVTGIGVTDSGSMDAYWFVSVPPGQPTGTYTFTYNMSIAFENYAT